MATAVFRKVRHTVWLGEGKHPYPECDESVRRAMPSFTHYIWTLNNYPKGFPFLDSMIKNGHLEIASEYLKVLSLVRYKGIYVDYNVMVTGPIHELIPMALKYGMSFARHRPTYTGTDYLSTEVMLVDTHLEDKSARYVSYILDYKSNFEYFYNQGERDPNFYGSNLLSRVYTNKILTRDEAYGIPHNKTLKYRSEEITQLKRPVIPYTAFYAEPEDSDSPFILGHVKPRMPLTSRSTSQIS